MTEVLTLLALLILAYLASSLLASRQQSSYELASGLGFMVLGLALGPTGLAFLSTELIERAAPAVMLAIGWLGLRFGLRLRRQSMAALPVEHRLAPVLEALFAFLVLLGGIHLADRQLHLELGWGLQLALAAIGSATTNGWLLRLVDGQRAAGPVTGLLRSIGRHGDLLGILAVGMVLAEGTLPVDGAIRAGAALLGGALLGVLASLLLGRNALRDDFAWVAMLGFCALGTGLAAQLGASGLLLATAFGATLGWASPHGEALARMTEKTERPIAQVLLVLLGTQAELSLQVPLLVLGLLGFRIVAKLVSGWLLWAVRMPSARDAPGLGLGLLTGGGKIVAMVLACGLGQSGRAFQVLLWWFVALSITGDLLGGRLLRRLLLRHGEIAAEPGGDPRLAPAEAGR